MLWAFPLYWGVISSLKPEDEVVRPYIELWPDTLTFQHYIHALTTTQIGAWYVNSVAVAVGVTVITVFIVDALRLRDLAAALSRADRALVADPRLASWCRSQALIINHFVLIAELGLLNTWAGIMLPQLIHPVIIIVYKQFFDQVPRDFREAAVMDNASEFAILFKVYLPMNWGVTTALSIVCFIWTWNAFLWPFLAVTRTEMMTITVGITQVNDAFGVYYARQLAGGRPRRPAGGAGLPALPAPRDRGDHALGRHQGVALGLRCERDAGGDSMHDRACGPPAVSRARARPSRPQRRDAAPTVSNFSRTVSPGSTLERPRSCAVTCVPSASRDMDQRPLAQPLDHRRRALGLAALAQPRSAPPAARRVRATSVGAATPGSRHQRPVRQPRLQPVARARDA